jgi:hypothetical protein
MGRIVAVFFSAQWEEHMSDGSYWHYVWEIKKINNIYATRNIRLLCHVGCLLQVN